jgi:para-nitrobenzyl esterase
MRKISIVLTAVTLGLLGAPAFAASPAKPAAPAAPAPAAKPKYTTADTEIGTLLDDPAAKAIVEKHIPGFTTNDQVEMARGMTLKVVQQYASNDITDARLAAIDADLAKLK